MSDRGTFRQRVRYRVGYGIYKTLWRPWNRATGLLARYEARLVAIIEWAERT